MSKPKLLLATDSMRFPSMGSESWTWYKVLQFGLAFAEWVPSIGDVQYIEKLSELCIAYAPVLWGGFI